MREQQGHGGLPRRAVKVKDTPVPRARSNASASVSVERQLRVQANEERHVSHSARAHIRAHAASNSSTAASSSAADAIADAKHLSRERNGARFDEAQQRGAQRLCGVQALRICGCQRHCVRGVRQQ